MDVAVGQMPEENAADVCPMALQTLRALIDETSGSADRQAHIETDIWPKCLVEFPGCIANAPYLLDFSARPGDYRITDRASFGSRFQEMLELSRITLRIRSQGL